VPILAHKYRYVMRPNVARFHLICNPVREAYPFILGAREFPNCRDVAVNFAVGSRFGFFHIGVDLTRDQMLDTNKVSVRTPVAQQGDATRAEIRFEPGEGITPPRP
jgi:hypothetical protein